MSAFEIFRDNKKKEYSESDISEHYKKMSIRCAVLKWLTLTTLVIFVIVSVSAHGDALSLDNIRYIIRYMKENTSSIVLSGDGVSYDYDKNNMVYNVGDDFAIVGSNSVIIYNYSGEVLFKDTFNYLSPAAVTNDKELIVYDVGGNELRFYNSYTMIQKVNFESPVYSVDVSNNGNYVVQTASAGYRSGFQVFNQNKKMIFRHNYGEKTLQSVSISSDGNYICSTSFSSVSSEISTSISVYNINKDEPESEISIKGEYPISIEFIENDSIMLFTDKSLKGYNLKLENLFVENYAQKSPHRFKIINDRAVITYENSLFNESTEIFIIDKNGNNEKRFTVSHSVFDFNLETDMIHLLYDNCIETYSLDNYELQKTTNLEEDFNRIINIQDEKFMISRADRAEIFIYNT